MKFKKSFLTITLLGLLTLTGCQSSTDMWNEAIAADKNPTMAEKNLNKANHSTETEKTNTEIAKEVAGDVADKTKEIANSETTKTILGEAKKGFSKVADKVKNEAGKVLENNPTSNADQSELANLTFEKGSNPVIYVNNNKSTLNPADWTSSHVEYSNLDSLNRVGTATAYLDEKNVGKSEGRGSQTWKPSGWNNQAKKVDGKSVHPYDRGHLIAYTLTFKLDDNGRYDSSHAGSEDNPKNLFTQTQYSNRQLFQIYEGQVRDELKKGHRVIYQVTPVFNGNEKVARGAHLQAKSVDGNLDFNVYVFNVQPGLSIDYNTGATTVDPSMTVAK